MFEKASFENLEKSMSILLSILTAVLTFFMSAFALKLALRFMGQPAHENKYGTAVTVAALLSFSSLLMGLLPFFVSWFVYPILWIVLVRSVYHISITKSIGVAALQAVIRFGLILLIGVIF